MIAVVAAVVLNSCAGKNGAATLPGTNNQNVALPEIDALLNSPARQSLVTMEKSIGGGQGQESPNSETVGEDWPYQDLLNTEATPGEFAWSAYFFDQVDRYDSLDVLILHAMETVPGSGSVFVGLADFGADRWRWIDVELPTPLAEDKPAALALALPRDIELVNNGGSSSGAMLVVVASFGQQVLIDKLTLLADEFAPPPLNLTASLGTEADQVVLNWVDPAISYDPDGPGSGEFEYDTVVVERLVGQTGEWAQVAELPEGVTTFTDTDVVTDPYYGYRYRLRTVVEGQPGKPGDFVDGFAGVRPIAIVGLSGSAPNLILDGSLSSDPEPSDDFIIEYRWQVSYPDDPNFVFDFTRTAPDPFFYELSDMTKINRFDLTVVDDEGVYSLPDSLDASGFGLWSPNLGCVQDDASEPDPKDLIDGSGPGAYTAGLRFIVEPCGSMFQVEFDSHFDGTFGHGPKGANGQPVPAVMIKHYAQAPNVDGPKNFTANIPANQPNGEYYMAVRVTFDDDPATASILMWPDKVTLAPQN
jgi:hypothetical protein